MLLVRSLRAKPEKSPCQGWAKALEEMMGAAEESQEGV